MRVTWFLLLAFLIAMVLTIPMIDRNQVDSRTQQQIREDSRQLAPPPPPRP
jgi:hypothetical protein